jgi:hypothetical protein
MTVNRQNAAVTSDEKRPSLSESTFTEYAVRSSRVFGRITENRVIDAKRFRKLRIGIWSVNARGKVLDVESPQFVAARPERPTLGRSSAGKRLGEPRQDNNRSSDKIEKPIHSPVGSTQRKIWSRITRSKLDHRFTRAQQTVHHRKRDGAERRENGSQHRTMPF